MTQFDYSRSLAGANRMIARYGKAGFIRRPGTVTGPAYDPTIGEPTDHPARFVVTDYATKDIDGSRVLATDKRVLLSVGSLTIEPTTSDRLVGDGDDNGYSIEAVNPVEPGDTVLLYWIQARK